MPLNIGGNIPLGHVGNTTVNSVPMAFTTTVPTSSTINYPVGQVLLVKTGENLADIYWLASKEVINNDLHPTSLWIKIGESDGTVNTLTGNTGGAITPDSDQNINIVGDTSTGITVSGAGTTLTISYTAAEEYTVQTVGATTGDIATIPITDLTSVVINGEITGAQDDYTASLIGNFNSGCRRSGGGAILIGSPQINISEDFSGSALVDILVSGNNLIVRVTGVAGATINWKARIKIIVEDM